MLEDGGERFVPIDDHRYRAGGAVELAEVALDAILRVADDRPLRTFVPAEDVDEAGLIADLAAIAGREIDLYCVHG